MTKNFINVQFLKNWKVMQWELKCLVNILKMPQTYTTKLAKKILDAINFVNMKSCSRPNVWIQNISSLKILALYQNRQWILCLDINFYEWILFFIKLKVMQREMKCLVNILKNMTKKYQNKQKFCATAEFFHQFTNTKLL